MLLMLLAVPRPPVLRLALLSSASIHKTATDSFIGLKVGLISRLQQVSVTVLFAFGSPLAKGTSCAKLINPSVDVPGWANRHGEKGLSNEDLQMCWCNFGKPDQLLQGEQDDSAPADSFLELYSSHHTHNVLPSVRSRLDIYICVGASWV